MNKYEKFLQIAQEHFFVETLETRKSDNLDFYDCSVWCIKDALEAAYNFGREQSGNLIESQSTLADAINNAVNDCVSYGSGKSTADSGITVQTEWESWESDDKYDVVGVHVLNDRGVIVLSYQEERTKTEA
jgi:hypothetical protein